MGNQIRMPAVAGTFYPGSATELDGTVDALLAAAPAPNDARCPKALIVPHAGYVYSGPIAASAFARIAAHGDQLKRIVLVGPAHRMFVDGLAWPGATALRTPLGDVAVDVDALRALPGIRANAPAHAHEHALEVELPFLQKLAPHAKIIPLITARNHPEELGRTLEALWGGPETLIVISSDLSHYLPYAEGRARDADTAAQIVALESGLSGEDACGALAIEGLLWVARRKGLTAELVDLRSSGDTAGPRDHVVGYGAFAFTEDTP